MSGGYWDYKDRDFKREVFGWDYDTQEGNVSDVVEDKEISEMLFDILSLMKDYDLYASGDTDKPDYLKAKKAFKEKWLEVDSKTRVKRQVDKSIEDLREELYNMFGVTDNKESNND